MGLGKWSMSDDFMLQVALGRIPGCTHINKFGRNPDIDQAASVTAVNLGRTIWDGGIAGAVNWVEPTAARTHQIASTSANDDTDGGGTNAGARTVRVFGLDANFALQQEDVTLNGVGDVPTANTYRMIHRLEVLTTGATGWNEGTITATADTDGTVTARITIGNNQTLMAIYQVPAGKTGYMTSFSASLQKTGGAAKFADIFLMSKKFDGPWRLRDGTILASNGNPHAPHPYLPFKYFEAQELVQIIGNPSADAQDIFAGFDLILVDD